MMGGLHRIKPVPGMFWENYDLSDNVLSGTGTPHGEKYLNPR
jgi:hypothetical protein